MYVYCITSGFPLVKVPVLSSTKVLHFAILSKNPASLNKIPRLAARPSPTIVATGVARLSAHGHAMTMTEMAIINPFSNEPL